jgi:hypothetical protein
MICALTLLQDQASEIQAEVYALEMAIHVKRAERERKRQELEAEFAAVFQASIHPLMIHCI